MQDYLADSIHMVIVGDDVVVLDVAQDAYSCLVGGAAFIRLDLGGRVLIDSSPARRTLCEAGFITSVPKPSARIPPPLPSIEAPIALGTHPTLTERFRFCRTSCDVVRRYNDIRFSSLIAEARTAPSPPPRQSASDGAVRAASLFALWLPWAPSQGACLYRAFMLRQLLRRGGLHADWVFGVATWPFSAHCWLQVGEVLLDDDVDRVRSYTPIMVV